MTDGFPAPGDGPDRRRLLLGGGLAAALLAVIGASGGWLLAGDHRDAPVNQPIAAATGTPPTPAADVTTDAAPRTTAPPNRTGGPTAAGLTVPALVGTDFEDAREQLRDRKLGWRLIFGTGTGRNVTEVTPAVGTPVRKGVTVTLRVAGPAPTVEVPDLRDDDCAEAADELVEAGLYPRYRTGRTGPVTGQEPAAGTSARWNDTVAISCGGQPSADPSPSPSPSPSA